jgi:hypothetical protein
MCGSGKFFSMCGSLRILVWKYGLFVSKSCREELAATKRSLGGNDIGRDEELLLLWVIHERFWKIWVIFYVFCNNYLLSSCKKQTKQYETYGGVYENTWWFIYIHTQQDWICKGDTYSSWDWLSFLGAVYIALSRFEIADRITWCGRNIANWMRSTRIILQLQCELKSHLMLQLNRVSPQHNGFLTAMVPIPFKKKQKTIPRNLKRGSKNGRKKKLYKKSYCKNSENLTFIFSFMSFHF